MPLCACARAYATVELFVVRRVLLCEECAVRAEQIALLLGADAKRRPVLGVVPNASAK